MFPDFNILKLHYLFQLKFQAFVYESVNKISPICFHTSFKGQGHVTVKNLLSL